MKYRFYLLTISSLLLGMSFSGFVFYSPADKGCFAELQQRLNSNDSVAVHLKNNEYLVNTGKITLSKKNNYVEKQQSASYTFTQSQTKGRSLLQTEVFSYLRDTLNSCVIVPERREIYLSVSSGLFSTLATTMENINRRDSLFQGLFTIHCTISGDKKIYALTAKRGGTSISSLSFVFEKDDSTAKEIEITYMYNNQPVVITISYETTTIQHSKTALIPENLESTIYKQRGKLLPKYADYKVHGTLRAQTSK